MTGRNERERRLSAEGDGRLGLEDLEEPALHREGDGGHDGGDGDPPPGQPESGEHLKQDESDGDGGTGGPDVNHGIQEGVGRAVQEFPDTHDLVDSVGLSLLMMGMFVLTTVAMYEQLPWRTYIFWGGAGYTLGFGIGLLVGRREPKTETTHRWRSSSFECRMAVFLIAGGLLFGGLVGGDAETWAEWKAPLVWVPGILWPTICAGGAIDGAMVAEIGRCLPRRTLWHALRFIVSERRRAAAEKKRQKATHDSGR